MPPTARPPCPPSEPTRTGRWGAAFAASAGRLRSVCGRLASGVALVAVVALAGGCAVKDQTVIAQAESTHGELSKAVVTDSQMAPYIQQVGDRIVTAGGTLYKEGKAKPKSKSDEDRSWMFSTNTMKFHFVNSDTLNAFTTGGEHMYVYTELLRQCKDEQELAAVMSHEYAHVFARHVQAGMTRQTLAMIGTAGAAGAAQLAGGADKGESYGQYAGTAAGAAVGLLGNGFTRKDESEADELGFKFYVQAGWDPDQFAGFFRTLLAVEKQSGRSSGGIQEYLSDHPATATRVANAEKWAKDYKAKNPDWQSKIAKPVADDSAFAAIKARSTAIAGQMPSDKALTAQKLATALPRSCLWPDEPQPASAKVAQELLKQDIQKKEAAAPAGKAK